MRILIYSLGLMALQACATNASEEANQVEDVMAEQLTSTLAKFEPEDGKCILFVGQELAAIGGLEEFNDGYLDHFERPGGFTMYTKIRPGDEEFGFTYDGLAGVFTTDDWGDGPSNMSRQIADPDFEHMALAIGLELVNHEAKVADGTHDSLVLALGEWIKSLGQRPVFLRIGYEFGGAWNHYDREQYVAAFQRIHKLYDSLGVENVAYVWQSHGWGMDQHALESWYPGDEYVDWCGYSFFSRFDEVEMIAFARKKRKPVFIAEATATISTQTVKTNGKTKETILSNANQATEAWEQWFEPFFQTIEENQDVVKAVSYINCHWKANRMWFDNPTFQDVDARLQTSEMISAKWKRKVSDPRYLHASSDLFSYLWRSTP